MREEVGGPYPAAGQDGGPGAGSTVAGGGIVGPRIASSLCTTRSIPESEETTVV